MQHLSISAELSQRFVSAHSASPQNTLRTELRAQIDEYLQRGGTITEIPRGMSASKDGLIPPNPEPGAAIAIARPNNKQAKIKANPKAKARAEAKKAANFAARLAEQNFITRNGQLINATEAAEQLGYKSLQAFCTALRRGHVQLSLALRHKTRAYYCRDDVMKLAAKRAKEKTT